MFPGDGDSSGLPPDDCEGPLLPHLPDRRHRLQELDRQERIQDEQGRLRSGTFNKIYVPI